MRILSTDRFEPIFAPLLGGRVGYVPTTGGTGDRLVEMAALQLFARFGLEYVVEAVGDRPESERLLLAGGTAALTGPTVRNDRLRDLAAAIPTTLLPSSLAGPVGICLERCYLRERSSLRWETSGIVVPELILGLEVTAPAEPEEPEGVWLRRDGEGLFIDQGMGDPDSVCTHAVEYLALAARFRAIVTDRPEFAMAALVQGRHVTLLPSASPVNRSLFDTWLKDLGCRWRDVDEHSDRASAPAIRHAPVPEARPAADALGSGRADPVFIIGAPRSGTTALAQALGRHSRFFAGQETLFLPDLFGSRRAEEIHDRWAGRPSSSWLRRESVSLERFLAALGAGLDDLFTSASGGRRWVDHVPSYALMADTLAGLFPSARFLHILRDGREVVNSMLHVPNTLPGDVGERMQQASFLPPWTRDFRAACETWQSHVRSAADFGQRHPERCLLVRHRDLEADPAAAMAEVFRFLHVPIEDSPANFLRSGLRINTSFAPPGGCPAAEYRRPDPTVTWTEEERALFDEICSAEMAASGLA